MIQAHQCGLNATENLVLFVNCLQLSRSSFSMCIAVDTLAWCVWVLVSEQKLGKDMARQLSKQGGLLLECAREWFISTGRRPLPVSAVHFLWVTLLFHLCNALVTFVGSWINVGNSASLSSFSLALIYSSVCKLDTDSNCKAIRYKALIMISLFGPTCFSHLVLTHFMLPHTMFC